MPDRLSINDVAKLPKAVLEKVKLKDIEPDRKVILHDDLQALTQKVIEKFGFTRWEDSPDGTGFAGLALGGELTIVWKVFPTIAKGYHRRLSPVEKDDLKEVVARHLMGKGIKIDES